MARQAPGLHLTGIDLSEKMLADVRQSAQQGGLEDRVDFHLGNVEEIPFPDQSLVLVISTASLHHWTDPVKVLNEIDRVLIYYLNRNWLLNKFSGISPFG